MNASTKITIAQLSVTKGTASKGNDQLIIKLSVTKGVNRLEFLVMPNPKWFGLLVQHKSITIRHNSKSVGVFVIKRRK